MPHIPVLYKQVIECAQVSSGEIWVDCTLGRGGHTLGLLQEGAKVVGFDQDEQALKETRSRLSEFVTTGQLLLVHANFKTLSSELTKCGVEYVDGILADLGVSSPQLDEAERGFSFRASGPLDMRMDRSAGYSALELLHEKSEREIADTLRLYGEEPRARQLAREVKRWATDGGEDTLSLARCIENATPMKLRRKQSKHPATRVFQALRIAVNDELGALESLLDSAPSRLAYKGRLLLISFHSLEDRMIKKRFRSLSEPPSPPRRGLPPPPHEPIMFSNSPRKGFVATTEERELNPRARSARLRVLTRVREKRDAQTERDQREAQFRVRLEEAKTI